MDLKLGARVRDKITGFAGTLTAKAEYLHGEPQGLVEAEILETKSGKPEQMWLTLTRLEQYI